MSFKEGLQDTILGTIPKDWEAVEFSSVAELKHGFQFRTHDFTDDGVKVFKITQINKNGSVDISACDFIDADRLKDFEKYILHKGDILMALTGATIGKIARYYENEICLQNYRVGNFFSQDNDVLSKDYLYHFLTSKYFFNQILARQTQSAQQNIGKDEINKMVLFLPPLSIQNKIATILTSLEDKIELNRQMNQTLEETAQTLFQEMCLPKNDQVPDGWEWKTVSELGIVMTGNTPASKNPEEFGDKYPFVTPSDFKNYFKLILSSNRYISEEGFIKHQKRFIPENSVLVTCIGSDMGKVAITKTTCLTNQQINSFIPSNSRITTEFMYFYFKNIYDLLKNMATGGSTMPIINKSDFERINILVPERKIILDFTKQSKKIDKKIEENLQEISILKLLRDNLLPKLLNGEVSVC
ncbi:hypothetical protein HNS38_14735 [Lentimicrobium sp. L6]|uniref:restriction endonuclease subunit S n=1 Tax=Lentimicrobium sp. L6 TaxID=2735916 RepID=UPI001552834D|nr:restriction endonuclease subunit S [Lentimicrobium sp. L6]NPD86027.1 hypothetical protein [Lentimicrobium sp. L6]